MEKLIEKYKEECDILLKVPSRLWKIGQIFSIVVVFISNIKTKKIILPFYISIINISFI